MRERSVYSMISPEGELLEMTLAEARRETGAALRDHRREKFLQMGRKGLA